MKELAQAEIARYGGDAAVVHDAWGKILEEIKRIDQRVGTIESGIETSIIIIENGIKKAMASRGTDSLDSAAHWRGFYARQGL